ncbi:MAG: DUF2807 domain-containing protein [Bacteroidia bacterium]|nr:DUF2807 domain-containing protein [Bacteroidia bacterium]NNJ55703.1 hypothetical protein [Bacteroidia bacterium]
MKNWFYIVILLVACSKEKRNDCLTSLGDVTTVERQLETFTKVYAEDRIKLVLIQDSSLDGRIAITAPGNLIPQIKSDVSEGQLRLENTNTCNFVRSFDYSIVVKVYFKNLIQLDLESIASASTEDTLHLSDFAIYHSALSDIELLLNCSNHILIKTINSAHTTLKGRAKAIRGSIEEISDLDARSLVCEEVLIDSHTPLNCYVNGTKGLFIKIYNSGNVYYVDEPSTYKDLNEKLGEGDLLKLN